MSMLLPPLPRRRFAAPALILLLAACGCLSAASASAADYTWSGGGSSPLWSEGANWLGGSAPPASSSIGTLSWPQLPAPVSSLNDLTGLGVNRLAVNDTNGYSLFGQGLTLGSGGLAVTATAPGEHFSHFSVAIPLTLAGNQTWDIADESGAHNVDSQSIEVPASLSGETANLTVNLQAPGSSFVFGAANPPAGPLPDDELGDVTINGTDSETDQVTLNADVNAHDDHRLTVNHVTFRPEGATGPLTGNDAVLELSGSSLGPLTTISSQVNIASTLALPSASFDASSTARFSVGGEGSQAGTDYSQLTSTGTIALGSATLELNGFAAVFLSGACHSTVGQTDTLISTAGTLSGTFGNAPDGSTITTNECFNLESGGGVSGETKLSYRINYQTTGSPQTVTITALGPVPLNTAVPTIAGTATEGQTLILAHGAWTNGPTGYSDQWQHCDSSGNNCQPITSATAQTYILTTADVGSTLRVAETASNGEGVSASASSAPTMVVQAANGGGGQPTPEPPHGGNDGGIPVVSLTTAQLTASLARQLVPTGQAARFGSWLKRGSLTLPFQALEPGTLSVQWFLMSKGAKLAKHSKATPVLVAAGRQVFTTGGMGKITLRLTTAGKRLLKHAKRVKLEAKGVFAPGAKTPISAAKWFALRR